MLLGGGTLALHLGRNEEVSHKIYSRTSEIRQHQPIHGQSQQTHPLLTEEKAKGDEWEKERRVHQEKERKE